MPYSMSEKVLCNRIAKSLGVLDYIRNDLREKYKDTTLGEGFVDMLYSGERSCLERFTNLKVRTDENNLHYIMVSGGKISKGGKDV